MQVPGGNRRNSGWRARTLALALVVPGMAGVALAVTAAVGASTSDPPASIYPNPPFFQDCSSTAYDDTSLCVSQTVKAIDNARSLEGVGPIGLPSNWYSLTPAEQLFVATNLERTARGLAPLSGMATRLDQAAQQAVDQGQDPMVPSDFPANGWASNWAGGVGNPLENIYFWMYYDGPASNNTSCQQAGQSACWIHRHNILVALACQPCVIGTAFSPTGWNGGMSWGELLVDTSGSPSLDYAWSSAVPYLPDASEAGVPTASPNNGPALGPAPRPVAPASGTPPPSPSPPVQQGAPPPYAPPSQWQPAEPWSWAAPATGQAAQPPTSPAATGSPPDQLQAAHAGRHTGHHRRAVRHRGARHQGTGHRCHTAKWGRVRQCRAQRGRPAVHWAPRAQKDRSEAWPRRRA